MKRSLLLAISLFMFFGIHMAWSQGVTTASMRGTVVDENGGAIPMANVLVVHTPTGTEYGTTTLEDGRFNIRNMKVGGPYKVTVSFVGFQDVVQDNIFLQLNATYDFSAKMSEKAAELSEVEVIADKEADLRSDKTGAMTNINSKQISGLPSINRSAKDLTRLTPQSDGNSFGGRNNLYNNFSLDGSIFNNSFGLDYATPGGQADAQPVSLDAIDQIQVSLAPFDVREGGFTGAGINAVTKSGTNKVKATVYHYFRNENMIGNKVSGESAKNLDFSTTQTGFSVGGPILKNKLFFFINAELEKSTQLAHGFVADDGTNTGGENVTTVPAADIQAVHDHLLNEWGYEAGAYQGYNHQKNNKKILAKLNWNISKNHNFSIRYNMLDAWKDILPHPEAIIGRGPTSYRLPFENSSYKIYNKINSVVGELNSIFSANTANKLLISYTKFEDHREPWSKPFPVIDIFNANGQLAITAGSEMFSTHNILNQDIFQVTDNFTYYMENHTITAGVNYEQFKFENAFNLFYYPWHMYFGGVDEFLNTTVDDVDFNAEVAESDKKDWNWSTVNVAQLGLYVQDEWQVNDNFKLTGGLRIDVPIYYNDVRTDKNSDAIDEVINFDGWVDETGASVKVDPSQWPKSKLMWSPRIGFNYDVKGDNTIRLRGGTGIFTGRIPFVWLGNQAGNAGIFPGYTFQVNATSEDFKYPQVWKSDLAVDYKFGKGWMASFEGIYGKDINAVVHRNYNMAPPSQQLSGSGDTRPIFGGFNESNIYSADPDAIGFLDAGTIVMDNVAEGHQFSLTGKLAKIFAMGLTADVSYTYTESKDYTSIPAEIAADAFQRNPVAGNPNTPTLSWSRYGLKHRIISSWMYTKEYSFMASHVGLFIEAGQGNRYSYTYAGDLNLDAIANNDLLYVPANSGDIHFGTVDADGNATEAPDAAEQYAALEKFIAQDPYLKDKKGQMTERNGASLPWYSQIDFRYMHDFNFNVGKRVNTIQLSFDVMNIGNMVNSNWGVRQFATTYNPISVTGVDKNNVPYMHFDKNLTDSFVDDFSTRSKWQLQIGVRYIF